MSAISDNLIHFLARADKESPGKQFTVFQKIIETGLRTGNVLIKFTDGASISNQIICFTDIPLRECNEHTSIYGKFGIGFKKAFVKNAGGNPARYFIDYMPGQIATTPAGTVESRGALYFNLCNQFKFLSAINNALNADSQFALFDKDGEQLISNNELKEYISSLIYSFSFDKEMGDLGTARDETREIDLYYKEREWRLVPSGLNLASGSAKRSDDGTSFYYSFERKDVNMIVVPNEEQRDAVLQYFLALKSSPDPRLKAFGDNPLPVIYYEDLQRW